MVSVTVLRMHLLHKLISNYIQSEFKTLIGILSQSSSSHIHLRPSRF